MKTNTRSIPLDMLSVEQGKRKITICTHRQQIHIVIGGDFISAGAELTFDQFLDALLKVCQEAEESPQEPSPLSYTDSDEKTPAGALQELKTEAL